MNNYTDNGGGQSPDYSDTNLQSALLSFISAFGGQYDGDTRIGAIELGLLGFWADWSVYPYSSWQWTDEFGTSVISAYDTAFDTTKLVAPANPTTYLTLGNYNIGFYDSGFTYDTYGDQSWYFYPSIRDNNELSAYITNMMGGEIASGYQSTIFTTSYTVDSTHQDYSNATNLTHISYLVNSYAFSGSGYDTTNGDYDRALVGSRLIGYNIYLESIQLTSPSDTLTSNTITIDTTIKNSGNSGYYYDLYLTFTFSSTDTSITTTYSITSTNNLGNGNGLESKESRTYSDTIDYTTILTNLGVTETSGTTYSFNVDVSLTSSMTYSNNPIKLCNTQTDSTTGIITISNAVSVTTTTPSPTSNPTSTPTGSSSSSSCSLGSSGSSYSLTLTHDTSVNDDNPLRGFVGSDDWGLSTTFPITVEFYYFALKDVMTDYTTFDWTVFENQLSTTANRNRHAIVRFYLDYPGLDTGVPQFLIDDGLTFNTYTYYGGGQSPDYGNTNLQTALKNFISGFGTQYDGDTRIAVIQFGLLGFWGEWHTYPDISWEWSDTFETEILSSFNTAFTITQLNARYASSLTNGQYRIGFNDDSFTYETVGTDDYYFATQLSTYGESNSYQTNIIGGEIYPDYQSTVFSTSWTIDTDHQDFEICVDSTHVTYMLDSYAFETGYSTSNGDYNRALDGMRLLGYNIYLSLLTITSSSTFDSITINCELTNSGTAPYYYDLTLQFILTVDGQGTYTVTTGDLSNTNLLGGTKMNVEITMTYSEIINGLSGTLVSGENYSGSLSISLDSSMTYSSAPVKLTNTDSDSNGAINLSGTVCLSGDGSITVIDTSTTNPGENSMAWNNYQISIIYVFACILLGINQV